MLPNQCSLLLIIFCLSSLSANYNAHQFSRLRAAVWQEYPPSQCFFLQYRGRLHRVSWFLKDRDLKVSNNRIFLSLFVWRRLTDCPNYQYMSNINCYFIDLVAKNFLKLSCYRNQSSWFSPQYCSDQGVGGWSVLWYLLWYDLLWEHWTSLTATPTLLHLHSNYKGTAAAASPERKSTRTFLYFGWNVND